jgi:hypothetical protein
MSLAFILTDTIQALWQTKFNGIVVNGMSTRVYNHTAFIDTSIDQVLGDFPSIANFYEKIPNAITSNNQTWTSTFCHEVDCRSG